MRAHRLVCAAGQNLLVCAAALGLLACGASSPPATRDPTVGNPAPASPALANGNGAPSPTPLVRVEPSSPILAGIRPVSPTEVTMTRAALDALLIDPDGALGALRALPETRAGQVIGLRLVGVEPLSIGAALGFAENDVLLRAGGYPLASVEEVLQAYTALRTASAIPFELERAGIPRRLTIHILEAP